MTVVSIDQGFAVAAFVAGLPVAQPRPRATTVGGFTRMYDPGTAKKWRRTIAETMQSLVPPEPIAEACGLTLVFHMPRPQSHFTKKGLRPTAPKHHVGRPDIDNLQKAVQDELTRMRFWKDDSFLAEIRVSKVYADDRGPGLSIFLGIAKFYAV